mgnify:CR=1 FL=1
MSDRTLGRVGVAALFVLVVLGIVLGVKVFVR